MLKTLSKIKLYKITDNVVDYYRLNVDGNEYTPKNTIVKKLTRNVLLSRKLQIDNNPNGLVYYLYGQLLIIVNPNIHTIVDIDNYVISDVRWYKDEQKYDMLNMALGIQ